MTRNGHLTRRSLAASAAALVAIGGRRAYALDTKSPRQRDAEWIIATRKFGKERRRLLDVVEAGQAGPYRADWAGLQSAYRTPSWFTEARFGIFIHYGVYAVPAFKSEWYACDMYDRTDLTYAHHIATYGPQDRFGYKDFIPKFTAARFDAAEWIRLFKSAGARYVVPVAEHHDGFSMYDSRLSDWTAVKMGPKRDIVAEVRKAALSQGLHFCLSSHRAEHDFYYDQGRNIPSDVSDPAYAGLYGPAQTHIQGKDGQDLFGDYTYVSQAWLDDWLARSTEIVERYQPDLVYFDWWIGQPSFRQVLPKFLAYFYNKCARAGFQGVVTYKVGEFLQGAGTLDIERGASARISDEVWQTCTSIGRKSWGYVTDEDYKPAAEIVRTLCDVVSKNGNLLLNVGPMADGTIPAPARETLEGVGNWLNVNGEAIYGTRPWTVFGEGPTVPPSGSFQDATVSYTARDYRFTTKGLTLYAIAFGWPDDGHAMIRSVTPDHAIKSVTLLGYGPVSFSAGPDGLRLDLPPMPSDFGVHVYRIEA